MKYRLIPIALFSIIAAFLILSCENVNSENNEPIVDAGNDSFVFPGEEIILDGSNTYDPDGDELNYQWTTKSRPLDSSAPELASGESMISLSLTAIGEYEFELTVNDGFTQSSDDLVVTVQDALAILSFGFSIDDNPDLTADSEGSINNDSITIYVPGNTDMTSLVANFTYRGISMKIGADVQTSGETANDFSSPVTYTMKSEDGSRKSFVVTVVPAFLFTISLTQPEKDLTLSLADGKDFSINDTINVSVSEEGFSNFRWNVDGKQQSADSSSIALKASDIGYGTHNLSVYALKDNLYYSASASFKITSGY